MTSRTMEIVASLRDPKEILSQVYDQIVWAERNTEIPDDLRLYFNNKVVGHVGREWGTDRMGLDDFTAHEDYFILEFSYEDYCRGCFMGTEYFKFKIPDALVEAHEIDYEHDTDTFRPLLDKFIKERIEELRLAANAEAERIRLAEELSRVHKEEAERAELRRLQEKYG